MVKQQITTFEFVRLVLALLASAVLYLIASAFGEMVSFDLQGSIGTIVFLLIGMLLPAFLAIFLPTLLPSWRYKMITATLILSGITLWGLRDVILSAYDIWALVGALIRLSASMTGALAAVMLWNRWKTNRTKRASTIIPTVAPTLEPATKMPTTSPILLGLSLISIPITYITIFASVFLVIGYSALLLFLLSEMPRVPFFLLAAAFLAPFVALWTTVRALAAQFWAKPPLLPAQSVKWTQMPHFNQMIEEVCTAVGTRAPDNVILHIQPTFFVTQQKLRTFDAQIKGRTLAIGLPYLPLLTSEELKAVLAHEFAHFSGRDTLYSVWVAPVLRSLGESITRLQATTAQANGWAQYVMNLLMIPSLLFLIAFYEFFASIEAIVSRSRELRADWIAASHFGSNAFVGALKKIVQYGAFFNEQQSQFSLEDGNLPHNHYRLLVPVEPDALQAYLDKAMTAQENEFDSHPTLPTRIGNLPVTEGGTEESTEEIQKELADDEAVLFAAYTRALQELKNLYARYQQQATV